MRILSFESSAVSASVCLTDDEKIIAQSYQNCGLTHSRTLLPMAESLLAGCDHTLDDVDAFAIAAGPGSFTGLRIGVSVAKTYGYLLKKKVILVSSLRQMAISVKNQIAISLIDAKNGNYYMGIYDMFDNDVKYEKFASKDEVILQIEKYEDAKLISNKNFKIDDYEVEKVELDIEQIVDYYKNENPTNIHDIKPNYLKLPQVLEARE